MRRISILGVSEASSLLIVASFAKRDGSDQCERCDNRRLHTASNFLLQQPNVLLKIAQRQIEWMSQHAPRAPLNQQLFRKRALWLIAQFNRAKRRYL
jgi:hypothetical protein